MWIDRVHDHDPPRRVVLDMDSSVSPTFGAQEGTAYNGHLGCTFRVTKRSFRILLRPK